MERGTLCRLRRSPSGGWYYNHQSWERGQNRVRYVPAEQVKDLRRARANYARFRKLVEAYVEQAVRRRRRQSRPSDR